MNKLNKKVFGFMTVSALAGTSIIPIATNLQNKNHQLSSVKNNVLMNQSLTENEETLVENQGSFEENDTTQEENLNNNNLKNDRNQIVYVDRSQDYEIDNANGENESVPPAIIEPLEGTVDQPLINSVETIKNTYIHEQTIGFGDVVFSAEPYFSVVDFLSSYKGDLIDVRDDIFAYLYYLWNINKKFISLINVNTTSFSNITQEQNRINLNHSKINFEITFEIVAIKNGIISLFGKNMFVLKGKKQTFKMYANNALITPRFYEHDKKVFLGWGIDNLYIESNDETWTMSFAPSQVIGKSAAFPYAFYNVTTKNNYLDLFGQYQNEIKYIPEEKIKNEIQMQMNDQLEITFDYFDIGLDVMKLLYENASFGDILQVTFLDLIKVWDKQNAIPPFLLDVLEYCFSQNEIKWEPLVNFIYSHRNQIFDLMKEKHPEFATSVNDFLALFRPGLTESSSEYIQIMNLLQGSPDFLKKIVGEEILGVGENKSPQTIFEILLNNLHDLMKQLDPEKYNYDTIEALRDILEILTVGQDANNMYLPVWNIIELDNTSSANFLNSILGFLKMMPELENVFKIIIGGHEEAIVEGVHDLVNELYPFLNNMFERNSEYNSIENKYKNLNIKTYFKQEPIVDENGKVSFDYRAEIILLKSATFRISQIKKLLYTNSLLKLMNFSDEAIKWIPGFVKNIIREKVLFFIPNDLTIGGSQNLTTISFKADNEQMLFKPVKNGGIYNLGYQFDYITEFYMQDKGMIETLTRFYNYLYERIFFGIGSVDIYYGKFWEDIISNVLLRPYQTTSRFVGADDTKIVATASNYDENAYIYGFEFNKKKEIYSGKQMAYDLHPVSNRKIIHSTINEGDFYRWRNKSSTIYGYQPTAFKSYGDAIVDDVYDLYINYDNWAFTLNYSLLKPDYNIDPIINFETKITIDANVFWIPFGFQFNLRIFLANSSLFFPFKFYDRDRKIMADRTSQSFSYFNFS